MSETCETMDRISELPPFIIHHIMSYLSLKEVVQTSALSKTWRNLRTSFPILNFDQYYYRAFPLPRISPESKENEKFYKTIEKFIKFVDESLLCFCKLMFRMQKLRLSISLSFRHSSVIDKWLGMAVENGVKELDVDVTTENGTIYTFPQTIFSAKLVSTIKLSNCTLEEPLNSTRLYSLRKLTLHSVCINERMVQKITTQCHLLEDLAFFYCRGLECIRIYKAPNLKTVEFGKSGDDGQRIEIDVPSLQQFSVSFTKHQRPFVFDIARCPSLKVLNLFCTAFTDQEFDVLISKFPLLEDLDVTDCCILKRVKISSMRLKSLRLSNCCNLEAIEVDTPNLLSFAYSNNSFPISSINAPCPWKVGFFANQGADLDTPCYLNLKEFLEKSNHIKELYMNVSFVEKISFDLDKVRESSCSLPCEVQILHLRLRSVPASAFSALLDGAFGICCPRTLTVLTGSFCRKFIKWLYKELKNRDASCCKFHRIKCWRHYLKLVLFESFKSSKGKSLDINSLMKLWPNLPDGALWLHLEWCFDVPVEKA